ncbi:inositol 1,3,4-trisphosphate 5/6-kinase 4 isoform X2 [Camellia sinensis]|uniref:inositol 1,3,4-trisphosphate 5/6-kinase 4 isoform X2 n=1 Tax=Camellia sinensis TaxID=4442 RepID=UPI0010358C59|nr:inositol 1,3,4-trisphosphate 5/6-kinase 4 isoform X2 [Camellia sinensis]
MGSGGGVGGILLDGSALLAAVDDEHGGASLGPGANHLLRKLRYSNIPTGISYGPGLSAHEVSLLESIAKLHSFDFFTMNTSFIDDTVNEIALAWPESRGRFLHVVSDCNKDVALKLSNHGWLIIILNIEGGGSSDNSSTIYIHKLEELPLTVFHLNRKAMGNDNVTVGYIMKPSREEDFAKRGSFPLNPTQNGLIFMPITFELPLSSQLQEIDIVLHKATDEIVSIEMSTSSECFDKITYTTGMHELERYIKHKSDICMIDPLDNIYAVLDRLKIQQILLGLENLNVEGRCKIRAPHFLKAIVFRAEDFNGLSVPLPVVVQEYVDHTSTLFKFYVLGDKVFHAVKKSTPNAESLIKLSEKNGLKPLLFDSLKSLPTAKEKQLTADHQQIDLELVTDAACWLRRMLDLTIFGFDVVIQENTGDHVIVDVNYLPSFKEVPDNVAIPAFWEAILSKYKSKKS